MTPTPEPTELITADVQPESNFQKPPETVALSIDERLVELDAAGFLPDDKETPEEFFERATGVSAFFAAVEKELESAGKIELFGIALPAPDRIPVNLTCEAGELTDRLYAFKLWHIPGFYASAGTVGLLSGGCLIADTESPAAVFLLRGAFRRRRKWLFYRREELLAHELCHSMRQPLGEPTLEEFFAYRIGSNRLRRYLGNCFINDRDALGFTLPLLLLPLAQFSQIWLWPAFPVWPFWILALIWPVGLLWRNACSRHAVFKAARRLKKFGVTAVWPVLFRCKRDEIDELGRLKSPDELSRWFESKKAASLRWRVICRRFIAPDTSSCR